MFRIDYPFKKKILACGAQQQAGFCLTKNNCGYIVNGLGNLGEDAVFTHYQREIERLREELKIKPKFITHDLHPEYSSTKYAQGLSQNMRDLKFIPIQHHKAHTASCMGENRITDKIISVVFDTGGWGEDGQIWGGEFFVGDLKDFKRVAHLSYTPVNNFYSSSAARLFDAVAVLIGLRDRVGYEGQGALDLERIVNRSSHVANKIYEFALKQEQDKFLIHPEPIFQNIDKDLKSNLSKSIISAAFHNTVVEIIRQLCLKIKQQEKVKDVILTGTIFQNKVLLNRTKHLLNQDGFKVIAHKYFPYNDNNISFGQAVLADAQ